MIFTILTAPHIQWEPEQNSQCQWARPFPSAWEKKGKGVATRDYASGNSDLCNLSCLASLTSSIAAAKGSTDAP